MANKTTTKKPRKTLKQKSAKASKAVKDQAKSQSDKIREHAHEDFSQEMDMSALWRQAPWKAKYNKRLVDTPEELWEIALEYFNWVNDNPLVELKAMSSKDDGIVKVALPKMRAMTIEGLNIFLGISRDTWHKWGDQNKHPDLADVVAYVNLIIREQKFTGAASDLLNANIISKDLGLSEKFEHGGTPGQPMEVSVLEVIQGRLAKLKGGKKPKSTKDDEGGPTEDG